MTRSKQLPIKLQWIVIASVKGGEVGGAHAWRSLATGQQLGCFHRPIVYPLIKLVIGPTVPA